MRLGFQERLATETMIDKETTVTDTQTLWGEYRDKRNPCSVFICLNYSHFRVQVLPALAVLTFFLSGQ